MARIKNILIFNPQVPFVKGGTEILVESLYEELLKRKFDVDTVSVPFQWHPKKEIVKNCMAWRLLDFTYCGGKKVDLVIATKFPSYLVRHPNKVTYLFHQFRQVYDTYGTKYSNFTNTPEDNEIKDMIIGMDNKFLRESKKIFTISKNVSKRLKKFNKLESEVLYPPPRLHDRFNGGDYGDYLLYVGRLNKWKRIDLVLRAMAHTNEKVSCFIAGAGEEKDELQRLAAKLNLDSRVKFLGYVSENDLLELYANCFGVFYAPHDEDYGFATVEAFLSKKPVIATSDSGGVLEFVKDGVTGCVSEAKPKSIADKIDYLFFNKEICRAFGSSGFEEVKNISWDYLIEKLTSSSY